MFFLDKIAEFLALFFSKDPIEARERRQLKDIRLFLKGVKPPVYKTSGNFVLPGFAGGVYDLFVALKPMRDVLSRSVLAQDTRLNKRYRDSLVERRLDDGARRILESCAYEPLKARLSGSADANAELSAAEADFAFVLKAIDEPGMRASAAELAVFERVVDLCRYDFARILAPFDPSVNLDSSMYKPKFTQVEGSSLAPELMDFFSVVADLRLDNATVVDLASIAERLGGEGGADASRRMAKSASAINKILGSTLSPQTLTALLRAVREESGFQPPKIDEPASAVAEYRERINRRWVQDRDRVMRELRESSLGTETAALFGTPPSGGLMPLIGYDDELNRRLQVEASRSLVWLMPLRLLKTFERRYLSQGFLEASRRVAVEGFFSNAILRSRLTDVVGKLEKSGARISAFEESIGGRTRTSAAALRNALNEASKGKDSADAVERITLALDSRAKELVEQDVRSLRELAELIFDVISDFRKPTPDLVTNIKTLASAKDKSLIPTLANGYNGVARFLKLMKAFLIVGPIPSNGDDENEEAV